MSNKKNSNLSKKDFDALIKSLTDLDDTAGEANLDKSNNTLTMNQRGAKVVVPRLRRALNVMLTVSKVAIGAAVVHYVVVKNPAVAKTLRILIDQVVRLVPGSAKVIANLLTKLARRVPGLAKTFSVYIPQSVANELKDREGKKGSRLYYIALIAGGIAVASLGGMSYVAGTNPVYASLLPFGSHLVKAQYVVMKYSGKALAQLGAAKSAGKSLLKYGKPVADATGKVTGFVKSYGKYGYNLTKRVGAPMYKFGSKAATGASIAKGMYDSIWKRRTTNLPI